MPVTLTGRDELGRIIDVIVDTVANVPPPGPEEIAAGPGGAAEAGTVVADPPELAPDISAAVSAGNAPSGSNPMATIADTGLFAVLTVQNDANGIPIVGLPDPTDAQDAATKFYVDGSGPFFVGAEDPDDRTPLPVIPAGALWVDTDGPGGAMTWQRRNATDDGWDPPFLKMETDGTMLVLGDGTEPLVLENGDASVSLAADGTFSVLQAGAGPDFRIVVNPDGSVHFGPNDEVVLAADGSFTVNGSGVVRLAGLPTADPATADGALWLNSGVLTVSS